VAHAERAQFREHPQQFTMGTRLTQCRELLTDRVISFRQAGDDAVLEAQVPPYEVRAFRWRKND
jgi:hypothetical protein